MSINSSRPDAVSAASVLSKAALNAARLMKMTQAELGAVVGLSPPTISNMARHGAPLPPDPKKQELAKLFLRVFRSLDAIVGGDHATAASWLRNPNTAIGEVPLTAMKRIDGLVTVLEYLDQRRAPI